MRPGSAVEEIVYCNVEAGLELAIFDANMLYGRAQPLSQIVELGFLGRRCWERVPGLYTLQSGRLKTRLRMHSSAEY